MCKDQSGNDKEIERRRDETLRRMLKAPPKPHSEIGGKRGKKSSTDSRKPKKQGGPVGKRDHPEES